MLNDNVDYDDDNLNSTSVVLSSQLPGNLLGDHVEATYLVGRELIDTMVIDDSD